MRFEIPQVKRCCCCVPLRRGLIFWIFLKLILALLVLFFFTDAFIRVLRSTEVIYYFVVLIPLIIALMEIAFCILFLFSAYRKNHNYMRIYYRYAICMFILDILVLLGFSGFEIFETYSLALKGVKIEFLLEYALESICIVFVETVLQTYLVILVRSEVLKLERGTKFEFVNHATEPECKAVI